MKSAVGVFIVVALVLSPLRLKAGEGNYRDFIVGDRAAGMGGAAIALATSVESCFYNPGGLARTKANTVSLSASIYGFSNYQVKDGWAPGRDADIDSFLVIPTAFGSVWKVNEEWGLAFSAFVPSMDRINDLDVHYETFGAARREEYKNINKDDQTVWLGPSVSYRLDERFSLGLSIFGVYRTFSNFQQYVWHLDIPETGYFLFSSLSDQVKYNDLSLLPILGVHYQHDANLSFGLAVQPPSIHLSGSGEWIYNYSFMTSEGESEYDIEYIENAKTRNTIPARISAGAAWVEPGKYALAFDLIYNFYASGNRLRGRNRDGEIGFYPFKNNAVVDFSLGGEYFVAENYPLRAGFFTSLSSAPTPSGEETFSYPAKINKYGLTASIGRETENTSFNLGVNYSFGSGKFLGLDENFQWVPTDARESFLYVFAGSSYFF